MKLGLVSDIHSTYGSLVRALDILEERHVDRVVCMGDIVHKNDDAFGEATIRALRDDAVICVKGNHDANAVRCMREDDAAGGTLSADAITWLDELPLERAYVWDGARIIIAHAGPLGIDEYVWPDVPKRLKRAMRAMECDVVVLGHTHVPMKVAVRETWIVNPGSVIGSRARDSHTCAVLTLPSLDLEVLSIDDGRRVDVATG